ncbi:putative ubiquitin-protein ligase ASI1 Ecym_6086 [Eremothecium cymbalariae DBVPG|uniref:RING-type domain-containing protein n=1 Tax=Eremothecium cymbalariae (strain CBS 270.75 / DBVPG 7215 / KCTC 17166 / NRRL Y-17582) TaxID=931890 RepID=G8JV03_ERECY|nr:hypothetical protein Ecym_6086 [Eremothecium cymbalariae DBVPG\
MNSNVLEKLEYLDQTSHFLINDSMPLSSLINTPYRVYKSFYDAIVTQYVTSLSNPELLPLNTETFVSSVGYFFSSYAVGCFFIALVLSRLSAMSGLRSNTVRTNIPNWSRIMLHLIATFTIIYGLFGVLVQYEPGVIAESFKPKEIGAFLPETYVIFTLSHCIETFLSITTNGKPLEESDYTIFELSAQFYGMTKGNATVHEYGPDCVMALMGRLIIHLVEVFKKRHWRLCCSTLLNMGFIWVLAREVQQHGLGSLSLFTKCKHFPKFFSVFIIVVSMACYMLACIVRWNPGHSTETSSVEDLQFHSFVSNWFKNLNLTGEEEFSNTVMRLAVLLCNPDHYKEHGLHRELPSLTPATSLHKSYMISSYMNKMSKMPDTVAGNRKTVNSRSRSFALTRLYWLFGVISGLLKRFRSLLRISSGTSHEYENKQKSTTNFNDYVNEKNYTNFMTAENEDRFKFLLPEEDSSKDYVTDDCEEIDDEDENEDSDDLLYDDSEPESEDLQNVLQEVISPQTILETIRSSPRDLAWHLSMWTILNCELSCDKRLTRSQYANMNEKAIMNEVILQRRLELQSSSSKNVKDPIDEDELDMACVVCKTNQRNIVLWPCRCFSLCEECRVSLGLRGFKTCVCCRADVQGYSRLNAV